MGGTRPVASEVEARRCGACDRSRSDGLPHCRWCGALDRSVPCGRHGSALAVHVCAVCSVPVCAECRRGTRRTSLCPKHDRVRLVSGWAEAARASDEMEAEVVAERLRSADVDVQIFSQKDHVNVVGVGGLAIVRVLVPVFQLEAATRVLAEHDSGRSGTA